MNMRECKKMLDAIKANVDEICENFDDEEFDERYAYCAMLADSLMYKAEKIAGFCITMELAQEVDKKSRNS